MSREVYLHAGAHRTGTSSFQMALHDNRVCLSEAGFDLAYPGRDGIPSGKLALKLPAPRHGPKKIEQFANRISEQFANSPKPLILSEENIPGRMFHFYSGQFYPAAEARLKVLQNGFANAVLQNVVLVIRPYDALYVSAFRKRAEDNPVRPFSEIQENMMSMDRGWPEIITAFSDILKPTTLTVVTYVKRGTSCDLLRHLVPNLNIDLNEPERAVNLSATDAALEALQVHYANGTELKRAEWKAIVGAHRADTSSRGFAEFTRAQKKQLQNTYQQDLEKISDMPNITLIS